MIHVHHTAIVETSRIGEGTIIGPFCYVGKRVILGENCNLVGHCSLGTLPEYKNRPKDQGGVVIIEDNVEIREFVTVNLPTEAVTRVGKNSCLLTKTYVAHDVELGEDCFVVVGAALGGFTKLGNHCYMSLNCSTHPRAVMGDHCLLGANSFFKGTSPAGIIWAGVPAIPKKVNEISIHNAGDDSVMQSALQFIQKWEGR